MSLDNLKEYARRCATEPELREKAKSIGLTDMRGHIRHASDLGLVWDENDMIAFRKEVIDPHDELDDLNEEELEQVAGGVVAVLGVIVVAGAVGVGVVAAGAAGAGTAGAVTATRGGGW